MPQPGQRMPNHSDDKQEGGSVKELEMPTRPSCVTCSTSAAQVTPTARISISQLRRRCWLARVAFTSKASLAGGIADQKIENVPDNHENEGQANHLPALRVAVDGADDADNAANA